MAVKEISSPVDEIYAEGPDCRGCGNKPFSINGAGGASASEGRDGENGRFLMDCPLPGDERGLLHRLEQQVAALKTENEYLTRTYAAVVESEREYHHFFQSTREAILVFDRDMHLLKANPASVRLFGYSRSSDMRDMYLDGMFLDPGTLDGLLKELLFEGSIGDFKTVLCHNNLNVSGPVVIGSGFVHLDENGQPKHFEFALTDITDRIEAEHALRENDSLYRNIYDRMKIGVARVSLDFAILNANKAYCKMLGYEEQELIGRPFSDFAHPDTLKENMKKQHQLLKGTINHYSMEKKFLHKNGRVVYGLLDASLIRDANGNPASFLGCVMDITERKKLETQLFQVQKNEAVGTLAGGVAHDFNNLLMGIQGRSSLISMDLPPAHPHLEHTDAIETHIQSAKMLTDQLVGFARGGKYQVMPTDMNELVHNSAALFGRTKKELRIHIKSGSDRMVADADRNQIEQVLLNLLINSWQAMPHGGEIFVECRIEMMPKEFCRHHRTEPGPYVCIRMTDTGIGMDRATQKRIFDPFFTTKEKGRGTGLGLASAYGIIKNHGGMTTVESEPGHGATFRIFLPASKNEAVCVPLMKMKAKAVRGCENILLVDDEDHVLEVHRAVLKRLGYGVVAAKGGRQAVQTIEAEGSKIDLVILDMSMPDMDGAETFARIRELAPEMRVLFCSGHALGEEMNHLMRHTSHCRFIQKPFTLSAISESIREMLDGSDSKKAAA